MIIKVCPECESENIYFSPKRTVYVCEDCENTFIRPENKRYCPTDKDRALGFDGDKVAGSISHIPAVDTRVVKVFLASSTIDAVKDKREIISAAVCMANGKDESLYIDLYHCEDDDRSKRGRTQQEEYNEKIRECDVFVLLSENSELGSITLNEEVMLAADQKRERGIRLFVFGDKSSPADTERGANWRNFQSNYLPLFEPIFSYMDENMLEEKAKKFIEAIRNDGSIGTVYKGCSRVGYNIDLIGSDASAKKYLNAIADKLNTLNNRFIEKDPYQSLQFKVKIRCNNGAAKKISPLNDNYFVIPCDENDCSAGLKRKVFAKIRECFQLAKEKTDVSLFRGENDSGSEILSAHEEKLFDIMDNNYSFSFSHKNTIVNKPTMNERLSEIREAYLCLEEGLYYLHQKNYFEAEKRLRIGADFGFPAACFYLGYIYWNIEGFKDPEKSEKYTLLAADAGVIGAMYNMGVIYLKKLQKDSDPKSKEEFIGKIKKYCELAIKNKMYTAYCILGSMYETVFVNYIEAERMFKKGVDEDEPLAQLGLALLYEKMGKKREARKYFIKSARNGNAKAMENLASYCMKIGRLNDAESLLTCAAVRGESGALLALGDINLENKNLSKAKNFYRKAAEKGYSEGKTMLGHLLLEDGELEDAEECLLEAYSELSADNTEEKSICANELGLLYERKNELDKAEKFYLQSDECGNRDAEYNMGRFLWKYYEGKRLDEAKEYYSRAADKGDEDAIRELEMLLMETDIRSAAAQGQPDALFNLGYNYLQNGNYTEAEKYLLEAYKKLSDDEKEQKMICELSLGVLYLQKNELANSIKYYKLAAEKGDEDAKKTLDMLLSEIKAGK